MSINGQHMCLEQICLVRVSVVFVRWSLIADAQKLPDTVSHYRTSKLSNQIKSNQIKLFYSAPKS